MTPVMCVVTDGRLHKSECSIVARMAQAGVARAVSPAHTPFDGDVVFCLATGPSKEAVIRIHERAGHPPAEVYEITAEVA